MQASAHPVEATYADLAAVPENMRGELIDGELIVSPRPAMRHSRATTSLSSQITGPFDHGVNGPGGWWIFVEPEVHLRGDAFVPDIAGWRRETLPEFPDTTVIEVAPDWICEVLSPSTERIDRLKKLAAYARHRVEHVWLVNPTNRTIEIYRREGDIWRLLQVHDGEKTLQIEPFEAVELAIALIWPPVRPAPTDP